MEPRQRADEMLRLERLLWDLRYQRVAGVDEVGLGPLAGPVVAAAVVFSRGSEPLALADSKRLTPKTRERLEGEIRRTASEVSLGMVEVEEIENIGIREAGLEAMRRAVVGLKRPADYLLVDARRVPGVGMGQSSYIAADSFVYSVAAASIVAKVHRDALMLALAERFPGYGFGRHMGYGTAAHMEALTRLGPCQIHRRGFAPVRRLLEAG